MKLETFPPKLSVVIVSFNTRDLLRECLTALAKESRNIITQTIVVDNHSRDGSADMVAQEFPQVELVRSQENLGFAAANNRAFLKATGQYIVLLNSDAFLLDGALETAVRLMEENPHVGIGGAQLMGRDGSWQPSARMFPSALNEFLSISGLAAKFPRSRFFGRQDRTWSPIDQPGEVDWVPGAFSILRRDVLERVGYFDERFFLYYEEVDLCRRFKKAGCPVMYWPQIRVIHLGGESTRSVQTLTISKSGAQLTLWRMRSELIYFRKHHGAGAALAKWVEQGWHCLRTLKHRHSDHEINAAKREESQTIISLMRQAWRETCGGRLSPLRPW